MKENGGMRFLKSGLVGSLVIALTASTLQVTPWDEPAAAAAAPEAAAAQTDDQPAPPAVEQRPGRGFEEGKSRVDESKTTDRRREFVNPDGTRTVELSPRPVRFKDTRGAWVDIDLTLEDKSDGRVAARAAGRSARFGKRSGGGVITLDGDYGPIVVSHPDAEEAGFMGNPNWAQGETVGDAE